ncbi:MAG: tyrosine-type recombinase/integrase [Bacillota bacterium]
MINIHQAFVDNEQNELILKTVKTYHSQRILTAPRHVASHLLETPDQWNYIIRLSPHNVTQRFKSTVEKEFDHSFRFHDLRHFFASVLLAENVPERYIMEMLGHSTPNMIRNVYGHIMSEKETAIKKQVSDAFAFLS